MDKVSSVVQRIA